MEPTRPAIAPLRERLPGYLVAFSVGLGAALAVGLVVWLATSARLLDAIGYALSALGAVLLLLGGIRGSGYAGLAPGEAARAEGPAGGGRLDPMERRRRRLMAPPDPTAFWLVAAGCAYLAVGVVLTVLLAGRGG